MDTQPLAYMSQEFLESGDARPLRIMAEYLEPHRRFRTEKIRDTVVFFGSARIRSREASEQQLEAARLGEGILASQQADAIAAAERAVQWSRYYEDARELAHRLTRWSRALPGPCHRFVVCSGGGPGIMEAANRGAHEAGGKTVGLNIRLPSEQGANPYISRGLNFEFHYFFMRKFWFAYLAKAMIIFPGGLRHARRAVRDPHARADAEARAAHDDRALRHRVLGPHPVAAADGGLGRDRPEGSGPDASRRFGGRRLPGAETGARGGARRRRRDREGAEAEAHKK